MPIVLRSSSGSLNRIGTFPVRVFVFVLVRNFR
jgi:hypothetical protein